MSETKNREVYADWITRFYASHDDIPDGHIDGEIISKLIRCKDCANRGTMYINMEPVKWRCMISNSVVDMMDYCSFGERIEDETD